MTTSTEHTDRLFPVDPSRITGVRIDGSPGVTTVDPGTAHVVDAGGETWLHWTFNGLDRAVNSRHIAEVFSTPGPPATIDLRERAGDFTRLARATRERVLH